MMKNYQLGNMKEHRKSHQVAKNNKNNTNTRRKRRRKPHFATNSHSCTCISVLKSTQIKLLA